MTLVLDWQKKLGYSRDPFDPNIPKPASKYLVGVKALQERVNLFLIKDERFGTIAGDKGRGKTMFLTWIDEELAPQKTHLQHYIDARQSKREDIVNLLLASRLTFMEKISRSPLKAPNKEELLLKRLSTEHKNVLIIDNAGELAKAELDFIAHVITTTKTHVIISDTKEQLARLNIPEYLIDKLKIHLPEYT